MPRVVFLSDTHLGFDEPIRPRTRKPRRGPDFFANFCRALEYARQTRADLVVHGGDVFFRSRVHPAIVDRVYQIICGFADSGIPIAIVPGNHERSVLPPSLFLLHPDIHVFDTPRTYLLDLRGGRLALSGFPYVPRIRQQFKHVLRDCAHDAATADYRMLVFHHAVEGARVGPVGFTFRDGNDVIAARDIPARFDLVLSGHIHRHQVLQYAAPVVFCGSIERTSFAERREAKGFCELNLERSSRPRITFHELPTRPMVGFDGRGLSPDALISAVARQSAAWCSTSIVRLQLSDYPDSTLMRVLRQYVPGILEVSAPRSRPVDKT